MASSFNGAPFEYENVRPGYPERLFDEIVDLAGLDEDSKVLEVGCGTGQATKSLLERGYNLHCLDIGENLLEIAREKFSEYNASFEYVSFEEWTPDRYDYDLLMSATAWHWIDPEIGYKKAHKVLSKEGHIALFWNKHPTPYTGFFEEVQVVYEKYFPKRNNTATIEDWIRDQRAEILDSGFFGEVQISQYQWSVRFSRDQYISLLNTFSDHRALPDRERGELYNGVSKIIDEKYGGFVERPYLSVLFVAKKIE